MSQHLRNSQILGTVYIDMGPIRNWIFEPSVAEILFKSILVLVSSASLLLFGAIAVSYYCMLRQRSTLPPGPFPLPVVGNCLQLWKSKPWLQFKQLSQHYNSGMITIWIGRAPHIFCNDAWSASDLMDKRSNIYSSRPRYIVFGELTGEQETNQVILPYGEKWRRQRKVMVSLMSFRVQSNADICSILLSGLNRLNRTSRSKATKVES